MKKDLKLDGMYICIEDRFLDKDTAEEERFEIWISDGDNNISVSKENIKDIVASQPIIRLRANFKSF